ncbi:MAG: 2-deoxystreptamine glucosyltransferase [Planctomycetota bacterium]|jgi:glycosyltransferase involved in cell wall biosynthesis
MVNSSRRRLATVARRLNRKSAGGVSSRIDSGHTVPRKSKTEASESAGKRILFVNQYYWPDHASTAQHLADLAENLATKGYECHVLCGMGQYRTGVAKLPSYEVHQGVHIHRVKVSAFGRKTTFHRMCDYLSYYVQACRKAIFMQRFDLVVTLTTPPLIGLIGTILSILRRSKHIFWSMDLHPDASLALGRMSSSSSIGKWLSRIANLIYRRADRVVVLGPYMADRILAKGVRPERVREVPVWSRRDEIFPHDRDENPLRTELGLDQKFVVMYSGNLGLAHQFDEIIEAAEQLQKRDDIVFLFVGGGPRLKHVQSQVSQRKLSNVRFMDYFPRESLHLSLSLADTHLITMRDCMTGIVVPGKLYGAMASARPTVFVGPRYCESADTIRDAQCGFSIETGDVPSLVRSIQTLADQPDLAGQLGTNGRRAFLRNYESQLCSDRWELIISDLIGQSKEPVPAQPRTESTLEPSRGTLEAA